MSVRLSILRVSLSLPSTSKPTTSVLLVPRRNVHCTAFRLKRFRYAARQITATDVQHEDPDYWHKKAAELDYTSPDYLKNLSKLWEQKTDVAYDLHMKRDDMYLRTNKDDWLPKLDPLQPKIAYQDVEELKTAPLSVRRIFSAEYGVRRDMTDVWKQTLVDSVRQHPLDDPAKKGRGASLQARIAHHTALIRHWIALKDEWAKITPKKPSRLRQLIKLSIDHRRKLLSRLRRVDQSAFEHVLDTLRIAYYTPMLPEDVPENTRKGWVMNEVEKRVGIEKEKKMAALAAEYEKQLPEFLKFKEKKEAELDAEEKSIRAELRELREARGEFVDVDQLQEYRSNTVDCATENRFISYFYRNPDGPKKQNVA